MSEAERFSGLLRQEFPALSAQQAAALHRHYQLLVRWNRVLNLTSVSDMEQAAVRHYCESLFLAVHLPAGPVSVLDIGSGAGFPGIPVAILRPDCAVTLAEAHRRKAVFLREATRKMCNVRVVAARAEGIGQRFEWVISRAVRWAAVLPIATNHVGLLLGQRDATEAGRAAGFLWQTPLPLPWGRERVLLLGRRAIEQVPRGTFWQPDLANSST